MAGVRLDGVVKTYENIAFGLKLQKLPKAENIYLRTEGSRRYDQLAEHRIAWTHPSVERTLRRLAEVFGDDALVGSAADALDTTFEESVRDVLGPRPRAAMVYEADFVRTFATNAAPPFFPFPPRFPERRRRPSWAATWRCCSAPARRRARSSASWPAPRPRSHGPGPAGSSRPTAGSPQARTLIR